MEGQVCQGLAARYGQTLGQKSPYCSCNFHQYHIDDAILFDIFKILEFFLPEVYCWGQCNDRDASQSRQ